MKKLMITFMLISIIFFNCSEEYLDNTPPEITILSPQNNEAFFDSVQIECTIEEKNHIKKLVLFIDENETSYAIYKEPWIFKIDVKTYEAKSVHTIQVEAEDNYSNKQLSEKVSCIFNHIPERIFFLGKEDGSNLGNLYSMDTEGFNLRKIAEDVQVYTLSQKGEKVCINGEGVLVMDIKGRNIQKIFEDGKWAWWPKISPLNNALYYLGEEDGDLYYYYSGIEKQVTTDYNTKVDFHFINNGNQIIVCNKYYGKFIVEWDGSNKKIIDSDYNYDYGSCGRYKYFCVNGYKC